MHGSLMLYLFAGPLAFGGLANYLVPLQVGAPDMAFPRLNALSYWLYLMGGLTMVGGFFTVGGAADRRRSLSQAVHRLPRSKQADQRPAAAPSGPDEEEDAVTMTETEALEAMLAHHRALDERMGAPRGRRRASRGERRCLWPGARRPRRLPRRRGAPPRPRRGAQHLPGCRRAARPGRHGRRDDRRAPQPRLGGGGSRRTPNGPAGGATGWTDRRSVRGARPRRENEVLLPALLADGGVDLAQLLVQMHHLTEAAQQETVVRPDASAPDTEALVLSLLLEAASELADTRPRGPGVPARRVGVGHASRAETGACGRVTAALHRLARRVAEEPVAFRSGAADPRRRPPRRAPRARRRARARPGPAPRVDLRRLRRARPGAGFVLVNDHDPKPLRYQFEAEHAGDFTWDSLEAGPEVWRVRIGRPPAAGRRPSRGRRSRERGRARARRPRSRPRAAPRVDLRRLRRARPRGELRPRQRPRPEGASLPVRGPAPERVHLGLSGGGAEGAGRVRIGRLAA